MTKYRGVTVDPEMFGGLVDGFELSSLEERVKLPYVLKHKLLISPGVHNGYTYSQEALAKIFKNTEWNNETLALFYDHFDMAKGGGARTWIGDIQNIQFDNGCVYGDVSIVDKQAAINLEYGAKFGISAKVNGKSDPTSRSIIDGAFGNWSLVFKPADKRAYLNSVQEDWITLLNFEEVKEMAEEPKKDDEGSEMKAVKEKLSALESQLAQMKKDKYPAPEKYPAEPKENEGPSGGGNVPQKPKGQIAGIENEGPGGGGNIIKPAKDSLPNPSNAEKEGSPEDKKEDEKEMQAILAEALQNSEMGKFLSAKLSEGMTLRNAAKAWTLQAAKLSDAKVSELQKKVEELQLQVQPEKVASKSAPSDEQRKSAEDYVAMLSDKELDKAFLEHVMRPESGKARFE